MKRLLSFVVGVSLIFSCDDRASWLNDVALIQVAAITPASGPKETIVTITGDNFSDDIAENKVTFNGKPATILSASRTQLVVVAPPAADTGPVTVMKGNVRSASSPLFTFEWTVSTLAGSGVRGYVDATGTSARFNRPLGIVVDVQGIIYVADGNDIRQVTPDGIVTTMTGALNPGYTDGAVGEAMFDLPSGIALDADGNMYVADSYNHRIRKIEQGAVSSFAGSGRIYGPEGLVTGPAAQAIFAYPFGVAISPLGDVYVADRLNHRIRKISGGIVSTHAGSNLFGNFGGLVDGVAENAKFNQPTDITVDNENNVYVSDATNHRIRKISKFGMVSTLAGSGPSDPVNGAGGYIDGPGATAMFKMPRGIVLDNDGNIYVADSYNDCIRKITKQGIVSTFAGNNQRGYADGAATEAKFDTPIGITRNKDGVFYVTDSYNNCIRKID